MASNSSDPWSPQYGTTTYTSLSDTQTPLSPSRYSYSSRSDSHQRSSDSDDHDHMRRITVSPTHSQQNSDVDSYTDSNSIDEVDAALNDLDDEFDDTEQALTQWSQGSSTGPSYSTASRSYTSGTGTFTGTGYTGSPSYVSLPTTTLRSTSTPPVDPRIRLSRITERTEESSRPVSAAFSANSATRPANPTPDAFRRSMLLTGTASSHSRSSTDPGLPPPGRTNELISMFETNNSSSGHGRIASTPGERSSSPFYSTSHGYGSRPSSPSKSSASYTATETRPTASTFLSPTTRPSTSMSGDSTFRSTTPGGTFSRTTGSYVTPSYTQSPSAFSRTSYTETNAPTTYTGTDSRTFPRTYTGTDTRTFTTDTQTYTTDTRTGADTTYSDTYTGTSITPTSTLRRPQTSPRSPLTSVRNIVALWKERTPTKSGKSSAVGSANSGSPPPEAEGLFGVRGRTDNRNDPVTPTREDKAPLPPDLNVADLLPYTQSTEAPTYIGQLWYLNVHDTPPYHWQRCQALLYPQLLLLSWLSPGGGRGIVALDLLNCTSVQSAPSPTHPTARDDIGTIAARSQSMEADGQPLMDILVPFHMLYADGVERLAAESLVERQRWVNRLWEAVNRPIAIPDSSSVTRSPTGSIRTILSIDSRTSSSSTASGSRSTVYVPPLRSLPSIPDFSSNASSRSSRSDGFTHGTSILSSYHTRTVDDTVISNQEYVYRGDPRAIQPARTGSLRRTSSLTDLDEEFNLALTRARDARPGLGFPSFVLGGSPVTVSSGPNLGRDIVVTPPPSSGRGSDRARSEISDDQFFSAGSSTEGSRSSYYSRTSFTSELRTSTGRPTDATYTSDGTSITGTQIVPSTLSYRGTSSASYLGDSHDSTSYLSTSPSRTPLSRTREVRRRGPRSARSYSSGYLTESSSDKENLSGSYTPESGTQSIDSRSYGSGSYTPSSATYSQLSGSYSQGSYTSGSGSYTSETRTYSDSGSYTPSGSSTSGSYPLGAGYSSESSGIHTGNDTLTPGESTETGYDICPSSDLTDLTGHVVTTSDDSLTPSSSAPPSEYEPEQAEVEVEVDENFVTASQGSSDYISARSPSLKESLLTREGSVSSYASFPTIPSESDYKTADTGYSHYRTSSEPSLGSDYISAELCPTIPSEQNTPTLSSVKLSSEDDAPSVLGLPSLPPSVIPSIRSLSIFSDELPPLPPSEPSEPSVVPSVHLTPSPSPPLPPLPLSVSSPSTVRLSPPSSPELPPLPPSEASLSPTPSPPSLSAESSVVATPPPFRSPSLDSVTREMSLEVSSVPMIPESAASTRSAATPSTLALSSSPAPSEHPSSPAPRLSVVMSPTISSVSSLSYLTPPFSERTPTLTDHTPPPLTPRTWAQETDASYESSQLAPSPSVISLAMPEGLDTSIETSFLRPTGSGVSSVERMTAIPETPTSLSSMTPRSPLPPLTPVPMLPRSVSTSAGVPTPSPLSSEQSSLPQLSTLPTLSSSTVSSMDVATPRAITLTSAQSSLPQLSSLSTLSSSPASSPIVATPRAMTLSSAQSSLPALSSLPPLPPSASSSLSRATPRTLTLSSLQLSDVPPLPPSESLSPPAQTPSTLVLSEPSLRPASSLARSHSGASYRSQASLRSSIFDSRSLFEDDMELIDEAATIPPLLTTPSQLDRSLGSEPSEPRAPTETPEGSIIVSLSTPQGSAQTTQSSLRTQTSVSMATERDLSRDIDRIADDLRQYDIARGDENRELADNVRALRDELRDLSDYLHRTPSPRRPPQAVPRVHVDERVGGSSPVSLLSPASIRGMSVSGLTRASSNASSIGSYLSSHHSDDEFLEVESYHDSPPPWSSTLSSVSSSESDITGATSVPHAAPVPAPAARPSSVSSSRHSSSPSSSSITSTSTVRQPAGTPLDLEGPLNEIRQRLSQLREDQASTNRMLDTLREQPPQVDTELRDRMRRIEELLRMMSERPPREREVVAEPYPQPALSAIGSVTTSLAEFSDRLRNFDHDLPAPIPARLEPSLLDRLEEMLAATTQLPPTNIQPPPEPIGLQYTRREYRSISPVSIASLPRRPESEPSFFEPTQRPRRPFVGPARPSVNLRNVPPAVAREIVTPERTTQAEPGVVSSGPPQEEPEPPSAPPPEGSAPFGIPPVEEELPTVPPRTSPPQTRPPVRVFPPPRPVLPVTLHDSPPRSQTAPAGQTPHASWYRRRPDHGTAIPADARRSGVPLVQQPPAQPSTAQPNQQMGGVPSTAQPTQQMGGVPPPRMPQPPVVVQLPPVFDGMMDLLRENRDAQAASVQQQRDLMTYMHELNAWLERDTTDRHNELRGLNSRVDQLREAIGNIRVHVLPPESQRTSPATAAQSDGTSTPSALGPATPVTTHPGIQMPVPRPVLRPPHGRLQEPPPVIPPVIPPGSQIPLGFEPRRVEPHRPFIPPEPPVIPPVVPEQEPFIPPSHHAQEPFIPPSHHAPSRPYYTPGHPTPQDLLPAPQIPRPTSVRPAPGPMPGPMPTAQRITPFIPPPPDQPDEGSPPRMIPHPTIHYSEGTPNSSTEHSSNTTSSPSSSIERYADDGHRPPRRPHYEERYDEGPTPHVSGSSHRTPTRTSRPHTTRSRSSSGSPRRRHPSPIQQIFPGPQPTPVPPPPQVVVVPGPSHSGGVSYHPDVPQQPPAPIIIQTPGPPMTPAPPVVIHPPSEGYHHPGTVPSVGILPPTMEVPPTILQPTGITPTVGPPMGVPPITHIGGYPAAVIERRSTPSSRSSSRSRSRSRRRHRDRSRSRSRSHERSHRRSHTPPIQLAPPIQPTQPIIITPGRSSSRSSRHEAPPVVIQPSGAPGVPFPPGPVQYMPTVQPMQPGMPMPVVVSRRSSRSRSRSSSSRRHRRSRSRSHSPIIVQQPSAPPVQPSQPQIIVPPSTVPPTVIHPDMYPGGIPGGVIPGVLPGVVPGGIMPGQAVVLPHSSRSSSRSRSRSRSRTRTPPPPVAPVIVQPTVAPTRGRSRSRSRSRSPLRAAPAPIPPTVPTVVVDQYGRPVSPRHRRHYSRSRSRSRSRSPRRHRRHRTSSSSYSPRRHHRPSPHRRSRSRSRSRSRTRSPRRHHVRSRSPRHDPARSRSPRHARSRSPRHYPTRSRSPRHARSRSPRHYSTRSHSPRHYPILSPRYYPRRARSPSYADRDARRYPGFVRHRPRSRSYSPSPPRHARLYRYRSPDSRRTRSLTPLPRRPTHYYRRASSAESDRRPWRPRSPSERRPYRPATRSRYSRSPSPRSGSVTPTRYQPYRTPSRPVPSPGTANVPIHVVAPTPVGSHHSPAPTEVPHFEDDGYLPTVPSVGREPSGRRPRTQSGPSEHFVHSQYEPHAPQIPPPHSAHPPTERFPTPAPSVLPAPSIVHTPRPVPEHLPEEVAGPLPVPSRPSHIPSVERERSPSLVSRHESRRTTARPSPHRSPSPVSRHDSVRYTPRPPTHRPVTPSIADLGLAQHLHDAEEGLQRATASIIAADHDRERDFRLNEEDRDRLFQEGEARRHLEAQQRADDIWQEFHQRIAALPLPAPAPAPPHPTTVEEAVGTQPEIPSDRESVHSEAQLQTALQILDTITAEREEFARKHEVEAKEREALMEQAAMAHQAHADEQAERIKQLEEEVAGLRAELENERQQRTTVETEQRERESQALLERDEAVRNQLGDITNLVQEQQMACDEKKILSEQRWEDKQNRRVEKDQKMMDLENLVRKLAQDMEESRDLALEAKIARERGPDLSDVIKRLEDQNAAQQAMLEELSKSWREDCARYHEETINKVEATAHQQVEFNIQGYLDEFSRALATEVRMLLGEVGKLRDERRGLQHELGQLLILRSKYGPGGEFDPDWKPAPGQPGGPPLDPPAPPPEPPAPDVPPPAKPGWRKVSTPRVVKPKKKKEAPPPPAQAAPPPPPPPGPQPGPSTHMHMYRGPVPNPRSSWSQWRPDITQVPSLPSTPAPAAHLLVPGPQERSPGLFGPRSPSGSIHHG